MWVWDGKDDGGNVVPDGSGYVVSVVVTDAAGNTATSPSTGVAIDTNPPTIALTHPVERDIWNTNETVPTNQNVLQVAGNVGTASDGVTVNGQSATVDASNNNAFAQTVNLTPGANTITVIATDPAGNSTTLFRPVLYDDTAPTLSSVSPPLNSATRANVPLIRGTFDLAGVAAGASAAVDHTQVRLLDPSGSDVTASAIITTGGFAYTPVPPLLDGLNTFRVELVDGAGNTGAYEWSFTVDRITTVQIQQPATGSVVNDMTQAIRGQGEPNANLTLTVNGANAGATTVDGSGNFTFPPQTLPDSASSTLVINAVDGLGNTAVTTSTIHVNSSQPGASVHVTPNPFVDQTHFGLTASAPVSSSIAAPRAEHVEAWSLLVGGEIITAGIGLPPASWTRDGVRPSGPLPDGAYPVTFIVTATNSASTVATIATTPDLVRDTVPPNVPVILFPLDGADTIEPSTLVTGTAESDSAVTVFSSGLYTFTALADGNGLWQLNMPLQGAPNTLTATATDRAGLASAASAPVTIRVIVEPPLIEVGNTPGMVGPNAVINLTATSRGAGHPDGPPTASVSVTTPDNNNLSLAETIPGQVGTWTGQWTVDPTTTFGTHNLLFVGIDTANLTGQGKSALFVDPVPPNTPRLDHPVGDVLVNLPTIPLVGTADPLDTIVVTIDGTLIPTLTVQADAQGNWELLVSLVEGLNTIEVNARDLVGNLSVNGPVARVTRDTVPPELTGWAKETPIQTGPDLFFRANITDTSPMGLARVTVAGLQGCIVAGASADTTAPLQLCNPATLPLIDFGTFWERVRLGDLPESVYPLLFWAQDAAGNTNTTTNTLTVDNTAPAVMRSLTLQDPATARIISDTVWFGATANGLDVAVTMTDTLAGLAALDFGDIGPTSQGPAVAYSGETAASQNHLYAIYPADPLGTTLVITATDRAASYGFAAPIQLVRDAISPTVPVFYLTAQGDFVLLDDNRTLVYGPQASGTFTVNVQARDNGIGLGQITFPDVGGAGGKVQVAGGTTDLTPYSHVYTIDNSWTVSDTFAVAVNDWVNNSHVVTFTVIRDDTPPQVAGSAVRPFIQSGNDLTFQAQITDTYPIANATIAIDGISTHDLLDTGNGWTVTRPGDLPTDTAYPLTFTATDQLGNTGTDTNTLIVVDIDPTLTVDVTTIAPYGAVISNTMYYGDGDGTYTVTAQSSVPLAGLESIAFGDATSAGATLPQNGAPAATVSHLYSFTTSSTFGNTVSITATDRAANTTGSNVAVIRDAVAPTLTLTAQAQGLFINVDWAAEDALAGLDTCTLTVSENGTPTELATDCTGSLRYPGMQDRAYTFALEADDRVSNSRSISETATPNGITKYYYLGTERVAMRSGGEVVYLHGDHLGSTSLTTNANGEVVSESRYYPYGEERFTDGTATTDFVFTGQRAEHGFGLMDYKARFYSPQLGRFISSDTIIPDPSNSKDWNRYTYVRNSPLMYTDPTGHYSDEQIQQYLQDNYSEQWEGYWQAWQADPYWMWVLNEADDNYVLTSTLGGNVTFLGSGGTFTLDHGTLSDYQGQGAYALYDDSVKLVEDTEWLGYRSESGTWYSLLTMGGGSYYQPIYQYTSSGPVFQNWLQISINWSWGFNRYAEDAVPLIATELARQAAKKLPPKLVPFLNIPMIAWEAATTIDAVSENSLTDVSYKLHPGNLTTIGDENQGPQPYPSHYHQANPNGLSYPAPPQ